MADHHLLIRIVSANGDKPQEFRVAWSAPAKDAATVLEGDSSPKNARNEALIQSIVRSHAWLQCLSNGTYEFVEALAEAIHLHSKVIRQTLRLAFLSPDVTSAILEQGHSAGLSGARIPKLLPLPWTEHQHLLG